MAERRRKPAVVCGGTNPLGKTPVPLTTAMKRCLREDSITTENDPAGAGGCRN